MDELAQVEFHERSLFEMLFSDWPVPLPLIGLAAFLVILSEAYSLKKGGRYESSYAVVLLLLTTGVGSLYAFFVCQSTVVATGEHPVGIQGVLSPGDRLPVAFWYYPSVVGLSLVLLALFLIGIVLDYKKRRYKIWIPRITIFLFVTYLAFSVASIPAQLNAWLEKIEEMHIVEHGVTRQR